MSFAERYKTHAFHDLIQEAEKQGIERGVEQEQNRVVRLFIDKAIQSRVDLRDYEADFFDFAVALVRAQQK